MVPVAPDSAVTTERAVDRLCGSDRETLDPRPEARRRIRLYQQMQMISLNAELEHAEPLVRCRGERTANGWVHRGGAQRWKRCYCTERHVRRTARHVDGTTSMRYAATP